MLLTVALCFLAAAVCFASDVQMGTWKLNEAKSKIAAGELKNNTVVYEAAENNIKVTIDGTAPDGTATHSEWTGKFDGKDYPSTGNPNEDTRSVKQVDDRTLNVTSKKGGKVVLTAHVVVTARWQEPHGHSQCNRRTGQEIQRHCRVRQAVVEISFSNCYLDRDSPSVHV